MIPREVIDEILAQISIVDVVGKYVEVKKAGKGYIALCPFHDDHHPSMSVNEEKGLYHCFSCGASGDTIGFLMNYHNIEFYPALQQLAEMAGVELSRYENNDNPELHKERQRLFEMNTEAMRYYHQLLLKSNEEDIVHRYVKARKLNKKSVEDFRLGYGGTDWQGLINFLDKKGYSANELFKASLSSRGENGFFDRFRGRLIFPIFDKKGKVAGFGGRVLEKDAKGAKYLNSSETVVFKKSNLLYGFYQAREALSKKRRAIIVEGYMDVIALHQNEVAEALAPLGTAFGEKHLMLLQRSVDEVIYLFDADEAGLKAANRAVEIGINHPLQQSFVILPAGMDPDEYVTQNGGEALQHYILEKALSPIDFKLRFLSHSIGKDVDDRVFLEPFFIFVRHIKSPILRDDALKRAAVFLKRDPQTISEEYKTGKKRKRYRQPVKNNTQGKMSHNELYFLAHLINAPEALKAVSEILEGVEFENTETGAIFELLKENSDKKTHEFFHLIENQEVKEKAAEFAVMAEEIEDKFEVVIFAITLKVDYYKRLIEKDNQKIAECEKNGRFEDRKKFVMETESLRKAVAEQQVILRELQEKIML